MSAASTSGLRLRRVDRRLILGVILIALAATFVVAASARWGRHQGGPLEARSHVTLRFPLPDGEALTWGMDLPRNPTSTEVTLEAIEPVGARGVEVIGTAASYPVLRADGMCVSIGLVRGFPPAGVQTLEVRGAPVPAAGPPGPPRCGDQPPAVLIGVRRAPAAPTGTIDALRLLYVADGTHYEVLLPYSLELTRP